MGLSVETYSRDHIEGMIALFNAETAPEGHIAQLSPELFIDLVERKPRFDPTGLLVALDGGRVVGWIHACIAAGSEPYHDPAKAVPQIRMLIYPRHRIKVGTALVAEATAWLKRSGQTRFLALHAQQGYPFYRGLWMGGEPMGPATMPQLQLALEVGGYKNTQESVFMVAEMQSRPPELSADADIELVDSPAEMKHEPMRESWVGFDPMRTTAMLGDREVGSIGWVLLPHLAARLGAPGMNIWSLGVSEQHRRKGIGAALIARSMVLSFAQGARFGSVGTQLWNAPAHATYAKLGFAPYCVLVGRTLDVPPAA